jgi:hypothetical protein
MENIRGDVKKYSGSKYAFNLNVLSFLLVVKGGIMHVTWSIRGGINNFI